MLPEGAAGKSSQQIANDFEFIGARLSVDSRPRVQPALHRDAIEALGERAGNDGRGYALARLPEHELERVRREHLTDLRRSKDEPNVTAERLVAGLVYPAGSGYAHPVGGTEASVQAITRDDLLGQFRRAYRADNAHLLVVGDVDREEVMRRAADVFGRGTDTLALTLSQGERGRRSVAQRPSSW